jgi:predicted small lipoprotein YifL
MMVQCKTSVASRSSVTRVKAMTLAGSLAALTVAVLAGVVGCGQKGPLTLPKAAASAAPASSPAPAPAPALAQ